MKRLLALALVLAGICVAPAAAQVAWVYDSTTPGLISDTYLNSAAYPVGAPGIFSPLPAPMTGGIAPFMPAPLGGVGADATTKRIYVSDGFLISMDTDPLYLGISPPALLFPTSPHLLPASAGPITGLGVDPTGGVLWASTATGFVPLPLTPPYVPLGPVLPIPGLVGAAVSGLDYETSTGTLWAVDVLGNVFHFTIAGAAIGPQPVVTVPSIFGLPMVGLGVNETNGPGSFPAPACSTQTGGQHVCITDGGMVYDALPGTTAPVPAVGAAGTVPMSAYGMAVLPDYQTSLGFGGCISTTTVLPTPLVGTTGPAYVGAGAFNGFALRGGPASAVVDIWVDLCPIPGGLPIPFGHTLWLNPFSTSLAMGSALTDAFGNATIPFSLVPAPAGVQLTFQWIIRDPLAPLGVCLTEAATFTTGLR